MAAPVARRESRAERSVYSDSDSDGEAPDETFEVGAGEKMSHIYNNGHW